VATSDSAAGPGRSLLAPEPDEARAIYFDLKYVWFDPDPDAEQPVVRQDWQGVRRGDFKLVAVRGIKRPYLFEVRRDPREQRNLSGRSGHREQQRSLSRDLRAWQGAMIEQRRAIGSAPAAELDEAERERLRALGYLE
jgi:hypothetical protein